MDGKQFDNNGNPVENNQDIQQDVQPEVYPTPAYGMAPPTGRRRIRWIPLALVLIVLGGMMYGTAWVTGSRGGSVYFQDGRLRVRAANRRGNNRTEITLPAGAANARNLTLDVRSTNITIVPTNGAMAMVVYGDIEHNVRYAGGTLYIETPPFHTRDIQFFGGDFNRREIRLYVPRNMDVQVIGITASTGNITIEGFNGRELNLNVTSGNIRLRDIQATQTHIRAVTGNITIDHLSANTLDTRSTSGNVRINDSDITNTDISLTTGNIHINGGTFTHLYTNSTSGNINVNASAYSGGTAQVDTRTGTVRLTLRGADTPLRGIRDNHNLQARTGNIRINGNRTNGNSNVSSADANFHVHARTTSGNIHVDYR